MNQKQLASFIAKQEGKKHQASVGDIREIIRIMAEKFANDPFAYAGFLKIVAKKRKTN